MSKCPVVSIECSRDEFYNIFLRRSAFFAHDSEMDSEFRSRIVRILKDEGITARPFSLPRGTALLRKFREDIQEADFVIADMSSWRQFNGENRANPNVTFEAGLTMSIDKEVVLLLKKGDPGISDLDGIEHIDLPTDTTGKSKEWQRFEDSFKRGIWAVLCRVAERPFHNPRERPGSSPNGKQHVRVNLNEAHLLASNIEMLPGDMHHHNASLIKFLDDPVIELLANEVHRDFCERQEAPSLDLGRKVPLASKIQDAFLRRAFAFQVQVKTHNHVDVLPRDFFDSSVRSTEFEYYGYRFTPEQKLQVLRKMEETLDRFPNYEMHIVRAGTLDHREIILKRRRKKDEDWEPEYCVTLFRNPANAIGGDFSWDPDYVSIRVQRCTDALAAPGTISDRKEVKGIVRLAAQAIQDA